MYNYHSDTASYFILSVAVKFDIR